VAQQLLDMQRPFVRAVFDVLDGGATYEHAVDELVAAERRHGIRIIREEVTGSLANVWVPIVPRPTIRQFRELMAQFPRREVLERVVPGEARPAEWMEWDRRWGALYREGEGDDTPEGPLFDFLTGTCFLVGGTDFANDHWIEYPNGAIASWTQRAWGSELKRWADATHWRTDRQELWRGDSGYAFFTYYLYTSIPRHEEWCRAVIEVIRRKCERQLDENV
jgi:hypothetical protein